MRSRLHIAHKQVDYPYSADDTAKHIEPKNVLDVAAQPSPGAEDRDVGFATLCIGEGQGVALVLEAMN
jgi:hypothetical protein